MSGQEQFIKLPREVLESEAFGSLGVNGFRVLRFLMIEQLRCGGRENGNLKAPHRQLVAFGIAPRLVTAAICEVEASGLVVCHRNGLRVATTYELTWLRLHDGIQAGNEWRRYSAKNLPTESEAGLPTDVKADRPNLPTDVKAEPSENLPTDVKALSRKHSCQGGCSLKEPREEGKAADPSVRCTRYIPQATGFRVCGKPAVVGTEHCVDHVPP